MRIRYAMPVILAVAVLFAVSAVGQEMASDSFGHNQAQMKFTTIPPLPTCATGSIQKGDPSSGPSFIYAKMRTGCTVPWHWHTPNEHLIIVSGTGRVDMKGAKSVTLTAGGFAVMAAKHIHQFHCVQACQLYIYSDTAFDIHYVDKAGNEITPDAAMKAVKETAATEMK